MPRGVYSTRFVHRFVNSAAAAAAAQYVVPSAKVAVVRSIDLFVYATGVAYVIAGPVSSPLALVSSAGATENRGQHWEGDQVYNAGETIGVSWATGSIGVTISGFLLNLVP